MMCLNCRAVPLLYLLACSSPSQRINLKLGCADRLARDECKLGISSADWREYDVRTQRCATDNSSNRYFAGGGCHDWSGSCWLGQGFQWCCTSHRLQLHSWNPLLHSDDYFWPQTFKSFTVFCRRLYLSMLPCYWCKSARSLHFSVSTTSHEKVQSISHTHVWMTMLNGRWDMLLWGYSWLIWWWDDIARAGTCWAVDLPSVRLQLNKSTVAEV